MANSIRNGFQPDSEENVSEFQGYLAVLTFVEASTATESPETMTAAERARAGSSSIDSMQFGRRVEMLRLCFLMALCNQL